MKRIITTLLVVLSLSSIEAQPIIDLDNTSLAGIFFLSTDARTHSTRIARLPMLSSGAVAVYFNVKAGDGGTATWDGVFTDLIAQGGEGGKVSFTIPLTTENEGKFIKCYLGKTGESYSHPNLASGGGGGSSAITLLGPGGTETLIAVAGGGGGACATEFNQSSGHLGGVARDGKEIYCKGGRKGDETFPNGGSPNFSTVIDVIYQGTNDNRLYFKSGNGGSFQSLNFTNPAVHQIDVSGKSPNDIGLGGIRPAVRFVKGDNCPPNNPFGIGCDDFFTEDVSAGGAGYSGGGAGGHWFSDLGVSVVNDCGGVFPYGGGGGGGYYAGGCGGNQAGGGGGSSYVNNDLVINPVFTEGDSGLTSALTNGTVQYRVILDGEPPVAVCQDVAIPLGNGNVLTNSGNISVNQGQSGIATITGLDIDGGSTDDGEIVSRTVSNSSYNCARLGQTLPIILTVTDTSGNTDSCTAQVTIVDTYPPSISSATNAIINLDSNFGIIDLGTNSSMTITPPALTFLDNCSVANVQQADPFVVTCADAGQSIFKEVIATDTSGNENRLILEYTVLDQTPTAICQDITISLGANGEEVSITTADIGSGSVPACATDMTLSIDKSTFTCADLGENTVTLTATNTNTGNFTTCTATVNVVVDSNAAILYVNQNTPNNGDGSSWANAFSSLQSALDLQECITIAEIRVASGIYKPNTSLNCTDCVSSRDAYFLVHKDMSLKGGFNPITGIQEYGNPSILSGDNTAAGINSDDNHHVLIASNLTDATTIDGFSITNGNANATGAVTLALDDALISIPRNSGAGVYLSYSNPIINNLIVYDNLTSGNGGGMTNDASNPRLTNVLFTQNVATGPGSALNNINGAAPVMVNNTIVANTSSGGASIFNSSVPLLSSPLLYNTVFYNNGQDVQGAQVSTSSSANFSKNYSVTGFTLLATDPFVNSSNSAGADGVLGSTDDGLVPVFDSALYNVGNFSINNLVFDLAGKPRIQGVTIEVGAYESDDPCNIFTDDIIYVDASATGAGSGFDWTNAFTSLDEALLFQTQCVNITEIRVASGTYTPATSRKCSSCSGSRDFYFLIDRNLILRGSYNTATGLQEYSNPSILSGDIGTIGSSSDNTHHVLITKDLNGTSSIDGFEIRDGNANGSANIFIQPNPNATISRETGGGLYNFRSDPTISNVTVINNTAAFAGGGVYNQLGSAPKLINMLILNNNSVIVGGGIHNVQSSPTIINSLIYGNSSPNGGGMFNLSSSSPILYNSVFYGNGTDIGNNNASVSGQSSNNFSANFSGTGFTILSTNPFSNTADIDGVDNILRTADDGLKPYETSPLVDTGDSSKNNILKDITGQNRVSGIAIDVGPYEIAQPPDYFVTTWQTLGANELITIPTIGMGYNYNVDWDSDGVFDDLAITGNAQHVFASPGIHTITISGDFPRIYFNNTGDKEKILTVEQWGVYPWTSMSNAFYGCSNLTINTTDIPNLTNLTDMSRMFAFCTSFNSDLNSWNVSNITNIEELFRGATNFNQPLMNWNLSSVTNMKWVFRDALLFNQDIENWDVSSITNMSGAFFNASAFNQSIVAWNVTNVTDMSQLFDGAISFDQNLGNWDISNMTTMDLMFKNVMLSTENYDNILIGWNTLNANESQIPQNITFDGGDSNYCLGEAARNNLILINGWTITDGGSVSCSTDYFVTTWETSSANETITIPTVGTGYNYDIDWNGDNIFDDFGVTGNATHDYPIAGTHTVQIKGNFPRIYFNGNGNKDKIQSIEQWGGIAWTSMESAFRGCSNLEVNATDAPDLINVTSLNSMFSDCTSLSQGLLNWDVSNVTEMAFMFSNTISFSQPISNWDVDNVSDMTGMFSGSIFNQNIGNWNVGNVINMNGMFANTPFNQNIGNWNVSNVINMFGTFLNATDFNQPLAGWDVKNVTDMGSLFDGANSFNQNLGDWDISSATLMDLMFNGVTLATENYDNILIGWNTLDTGETQIPTNITFSGGNSSYCSGEFARTNLISNSGWTITDGDLGCIKPLLIESNPQGIAINVALDTTIILTFDDNVNATNVNTNTILVYGSQTGAIAGMFSGGGTTEVTFNPTTNFKPGEMISISLTAAIVNNPTIIQFTAAVSPDSPGQFLNAENSISTTANGAREVTSVDLDGDGDLDVLSASSNDDTIAWYENDGVGGFGVPIIISTSADAAFSLSTADLDGDGDLDVLSASFNDNNIAWYENDGVGTWIKVNITTSANGARSVSSADIDGDGDLDVLSASQNDNTVAWYENDGSGTWTRHNIATDAIGALDVTTADIDGDGDLDVLSASFTDDTIAWYENDGFGTWLRFDITTSADGANTVTTADVDGDGDVDVLSASLVDNRIAWYENDGSGNFGVQQNITTEAAGALDVTTADVDGDGDLDVVSASDFDDKIAWYENDGTGTFGLPQIISTFADGAQSVSLADVDGDGDLDVLAASASDNTIAWFENGAYLRTNWTGNEDENWENNLNWNNGMPDSEAIAIIEDVSLHTPKIDALTLAEVNQLQIDNMASLTVHGVLKVIDKIQNNGQITFKSNETKTGQLDEFNGSYSGSGTVEVERFIPAGDNEKRAFRFLSSSVNSTENIRTNWQEGATAWNDNPSSGFGTHITGVSPDPDVNANPDKSQDGDNGFDWQPSGNSSLFLFNVSIQEWEAINNTNANNLEAGKAYRLMVRGDRSINLMSNASIPTNTVLRAKGDLVFGPVDVSTDLAQGADEFSLVGNPYQAVIDFSEVEKTNLINYIAVWDANLTGSNGRGSYVSVDISETAPSPSSSGASKFIAPNQAFFVRNTSAGNSTLIFNEGNKATAATQVTVFNTYSDFYINSRLYKTVDLQNGNTEVDAIGLRFNQNFTTLADEEDAEKLTNPDENYATINNGLRVIDKQNLPTDGHEIALFINSYTETNYSLTFEIGNQPEGIEVFLNDTYLDTQVALIPNTVYNFIVDGNLPASMMNNRFHLSFNNTTLGIEDNIFSNNFTVYPNPVEDVFYVAGIDEEFSLTIYDVLGREVLQSKLQDATAPIYITHLQSGVYVVKVKTADNSFSQQIIKK
jgi:surface protein